MRTAIPSHPPAAADIVGETGKDGRLQKRPAFLSRGPSVQKSSPEVCIEIHVGVERESIVKAGSCGELPLEESPAPVEGIDYPDMGVRHGIPDVPGLAAKDSIGEVPHRIGVDIGISELFVSGRLHDVKTLHSEPGSGIWGEPFSHCNLDRRCKCPGPYAGIRHGIRTDSGGEEPVVKEASVPAAIRLPVIPALVAETVLKAGKS